MNNPIEVGSGATYTIRSDRYPFTVVKILSERRVVVQRDNYQRIDDNGISEKQVYSYSPNPEADRIIVSKRKDGTWREQGDKSYGSFNFGVRKAYFDPCF